MNEIRGWFSSLWGDGDDSHEMREMNTYAYEPIPPEIVSNGIKLRCKTYKNNDQVTSYLYFGLDEGKPYIKVDHHYNNNIKEEKFMITSCYAESGRGAWFVEYECENGIIFHFIRIYRTIEMTVKKNGLRGKCYEIDVKREPRFILFNKEDVKSEMGNDLRDLYKFAELFEHAY